MKSIGMSSATPVRSPADDTWLLIARMMLMLLFVVSGAQKIGDPADLARMAIAPKGIPFPLLAAWLAIVFEIGGSAMIVLGYRTRWAAIAFTVYILVLGPWFHQFWHYSFAKDGMIAQMMKDDFFHHTTMAAGFILLAVAGPGRFSLDARQDR